MYSIAQIIEYLGWIDIIASYLVFRIVVAVFKLVF